MILLLMAQTISQMKSYSAKKMPFIALFMNQEVSWPVLRHGNYPLGNFIWSVIPNLIVGNTVVFKHSEECPLVAKLLEELMLTLKDLPPDVFSAIYGDAAEGTLLTSQKIDMIWFTGSSSVGGELAAIAGKAQIRAMLEMGGSNPAIILEDVLINPIIEKIYKGRFTNGGQV
jgi:acyl-CoA reductase-like NAD-dependent aldehyde dehydrogenase